MDWRIHQLERIIPSHLNIHMRASKYQGERVVFHWHQVYNLPVNLIRIFNAYGTRVGQQVFMERFSACSFKQKLAGKPFIVVGDGTQTRDFIFVTDVAKAFLCCS